MKIHRYVRTFIDENKSRILELIIDKEVNCYYLQIRLFDSEDIIWIPLNKQLFSRLCNVYEKNYVEDHQENEIITTKRYP